MCENVSKNVFRFLNFYNLCHFTLAPAYYKIYYVINIETTDI